eukprot:TRINITY_DN13257_c0_g2_i6.p1 TRINITY_DN13257_c0_g2~~TRINITY_DN13257_c0_g2_i6.p1  ORF type:complete len:122 (+),score=23.43 TRINITY_DN13257_c0_g2_i6:45-410(+)
MQRLSEQLLVCIAAATAAGPVLPPSAFEEAPPPVLADETCNDVEKGAVLLQRALGRSRTNRQAEGDLNGRAALPLLGGASTRCGIGQIVRVQGVLNGSSAEGSSGARLLALKWKRRSRKAH